MINGKRIKIAREKSGLTQAKLGKVLGVSSVTIWRWEANGVELDDLMLMELSAATDTAKAFFRDEPILTPPILGHQEKPKAWTEGKEVCDNCNFFRYGDHGQKKVCRRFPTVVDVFWLGWCGEWELRDGE
jgi:transcriptional regulator with XRE-family HTH domain